MKLALTSVAAPPLAARASPGKLKLPPVPIATAPAAAGTSETAAAIFCSTSSRVVIGSAPLRDPVSLMPGGDVDPLPVSDMCRSFPLVHEGPMLYANKIHASARNGPPVGEHAGRGILVAC